MLGLYRSGSSAVAGVLHHLGVDMGYPFWRSFYEPLDLSADLRAWWNEPHLVEAAPAAERVAVLRRWVGEREKYWTGWVGAKHPLFCLCGEDLVCAWGPETRLIWSHRPPDESINSLQHLGWFDGREAEVQQILYERAANFFDTHDHLRVEFHNLLGDPDEEIRRIVAYLGLTSSPIQIAAAVHSVRPRQQLK